MPKVIKKIFGKGKKRMRPIPASRYDQMVEHIFKQIYDISEEDQEKSDDEFEEKLDEIDDEKQIEKLIAKREEKISRHQSKFQQKAKKELEKLNKKKIKIRQNYQWYSVTFQNEAQFYKFLDKFEYYGIIQEKNPLIIRHYDLLKNGESYRSINLYNIDTYVKPEKEEKTNEYQKKYDDKWKIDKNGKILNEKEQKNGSKLIGIRCNYIWLQLIFYYKWEFDDLINRKYCYGMKNENNDEIIKNWNNLSEVDYRMFDLGYVDKFNDPLYDPSLSKAELSRMRNENGDSQETAKDGKKFKKKRLSGSKLSKGSKQKGGWFSSKSSNQKL